MRKRYYKGIYMQNSITWHVGVDGGGTSCRVAMLGAGDERRVATGGPANVTSDFSGAVRTIADLIDGLLPAAGKARLLMHLGLAGVTGPAMAKRVEAALLARYPGGRVRASGDQVTMTVGALGAHDGGLIGIGTGSFVARQSAGQVQGIGGRGLILGDQASGGWLGLRLLQEVMLAHDGLRVATPLIVDILDEHHNDPAQIIAFARDARPADFAQLAPRVLDGAKAGDPLAVDLMREGAAYLAAALSALGWRADERLCVGGGLGPAYVPYLAPETQAAIIPALGTAIDGALTLAARLAEHTEAAR